MTLVRALVAACVLAGGISAFRWLRVAQREHYLTGSVSRFAIRWWMAGPAGLVLLGLALIALVVAGWWAPAGFVTAGVVAIGPPGLGLRGRTSKLAWTARARRLALGAVAWLALGAAVGLLVDPMLAAVGALFLPAGLDLVLAAVAPLERRLGERWVRSAAAALAGSGADVVAITGSYGKTTTKGYVAHLLTGHRRVLASPASFNNRMGLARAINENLNDGVEVFVAEMGAYGPGEIAELCSWIRPRVGVITAIGPVHLERFGTEDQIVAAKAEILVGVDSAVLNTDDRHLADLAETRSGRVIRVGTDAGVQVRVGPDGTVSVDGRPVGTAPPTAHPTNLACALGVVVALGVDPGDVSDRLGSVPEPDHRRTLATGASGVRIVDDTFNANPAGARAALKTLAGLDVRGRRVVVTPGMVELGSLQDEANRQFAEEASRVADVVIVVGRTNRSALVEGAAGADRLLVMATRQEAVAWVKEHLSADDAVLYENDLPDHYP